MERPIAMKVIDDPKNPVFVSPASNGRKLFLCIGERKRGKRRIATPTTGEARMLSHALMLFAEQKDEHYRQMNRELRQAKQQRKKLSAG
jgi:hypothetical protein